MKVRVYSSAKSPGRRPTPAGKDLKVLKECGVELRNIGDLVNFLQLMLNTIKVLQLST